MTIEKLKNEILQNKKFSYLMLNNDYTIDINKENVYEKLFDLEFIIYEFTKLNNNLSRSEMHITSTKLINLIEQIKKCINDLDFNAKIKVFIHDLLHDCKSQIYQRLVFA